MLMSTSKHYLLKAIAFYVNICYNWVIVTCKYFNFSNNYKEDLIYDEITEME